MKRVVHVWMVCMTLFGSMQMANAQTYFEDFESGFLDSTMIWINGDSLTPALADDSVWADTAWIVTGSSAFTGFAALSISWYADELGNDVGPCDDWLILPKMVIDTGAVLEFDAKSATSSGSFPDDYWVLIGTGEPTIESFQDSGAILLQIDDEASDQFTPQSIDLATYAGQEVHIAFRNITNTDGYGLWLDNIYVGKPGALSLEPDNDFFVLELFPNPAQGQSRLTYSLESAAEIEVLVRDLAGRIVSQVEQGYRPAGVYESVLDANGLTSGMYIVTIRTGEKIGTKRWIITE